MKSNKQETPKILLTISAIVIVLVYSFLRPIAQKAQYHNFSNEVTIAGVTNGTNVLSNVGFVLVGIWGIIYVIKNKMKNPIIITLFCGMILTGFGSAYYHYAPDNKTLVWDRLPMTVVFTAFFAQLYAWYFSYKTALWVWFTCFLLGIISVLYWQHTESMHAGDLRLYAIVQFLPMLLIIVICVLHKNENKILHLPLILTIVCYVSAKLFEYYDDEIFQLTHTISGHLLKHIAAALATACIVWMIQRYYKISSPN